MSKSSKPRRRVSVDPLIRQYFTDGVHPFEKITWDRRDALIGNPDNPVFEQRGVEVPASWTQNATNIVAQKYFRGKMGSPEREQSVKQMIGRVADTITGWGLDGGYFATDGEAETFRHELIHLLVEQKMAFNSPVWFNCGHEDHPQCSACFILSVDDSMDDILEWIREEGLIFKGGSGSGINLSNIRSSAEQLSKGGHASGPVSFMRGADASAGTIKSGGKCLAPWTKVYTAERGPVAVEELAQIGETFSVLSHDPALGHLRITTARAWESGQKTLVRLTTDRGEYVMSEDHPVLMADGQYLPVADISAGMSVQPLVFDGEPLLTVVDQFNMLEQEVISTEVLEHSVVYDVEVDSDTPDDRSSRDGHNFLIVSDTEDGRSGYTGIFVHNTRRAAKMIVLNIDHPDIEEFIWCKSVEEEKARALAAAGFDMSLDSSHWNSIQYQNANNSVRVDDEFMQAVVADSDFSTKAVTTGEPLNTYRARGLMYQMAEAAWKCADPGVQYDTTINDWHTCPESGRINGSNPCFPADARVHTALGLLPIGELYERMSNGEQIEVYTHRATAENPGEGVLTSVPVAVMQNGVKPILNLTFANGQQLRCTPNHRIWTLNRGYVRAEDLTGDDEVLINDSATPSTRGDAGTLSASDIPFTASEAAQVEFLKQFFAEYGSEVRDPLDHARSYVLVRREQVDVLQRVQILLTAFGVRSVISWEAGELIVTGSDLTRLGAIVGFSADFADVLGADLPETPAGTTLASRDVDGNEVVYNLTEPLHHSYIVDGIVVANCSEYMHVDDSACNLASINLMKFVDDNDVFDVVAYEQAIDVTITAQEIIVGYSSYPTEKITENAKKMRQLGIGYANLGALLMSNGLPYDSDEGRAYAAALTAILTGRAYRQSARIAQRLGAYEAYELNKDAHLRVMEKHLDAVSGIDVSLTPSHVLSAAQDSWEEALELGRKHGYRNAQASVLAPTGTISFLMDCDTTGIEPDFALVKMKKLVGGGDMTIVNLTVPRALKKLGYAGHEIDDIVEWIARNYSVVGAPFLKEEHYPVFDCAIGQRAISYMGHVKMMAAAQPFLSGAISKTVNMPEDSTVEDIMDLYIEAWKLGVKAIAIYRDGSKTAQPLASKSDEEEKVVEVVHQPIRRTLPLDRNEVGRKFQVGEYEGYIHVGLYEDGTPGDIFVNIAKEGTTLAGLMNSLMISVSLGLQYGVPLEVYVKKFSHLRFEPSGFTNDPDIRNAKSIVDYIFRWMGKKFLDADAHHELGILTPEVRARLAAAADEALEAPKVEVAPKPSASLFSSHNDAQPCARCGGPMIRTGACYTCTDCGNNTGCG